MSSFSSSSSSSSSFPSFWLLLLKTTERSGEIDRLTGTNGASNRLYSVKRGDWYFVNVFSKGSKRICFLMDCEKFHETVVSNAIV